MKRSVSIFGERFTEELNPSHVRLDLLGIFLLELKRRAIEASL